MHSGTLVRGTRSRGLATIALAAVLWGTVGVTTQAVYHLADTSSLAVAFFRLALAVPALGLASAVAPGRGIARVARGHLALMGLTGVMLALYQLCFFAAIARVGVSVATLVTLCTAPVLVALLSGLVLRERPTSRLVLALGGALVGTALLVERPAEGADGPAGLIGVLLALASALGYAVVALCSRFLAGRYRPLESMTVSFGAGAALLLPIAGAAGLGSGYGAAGWALLLYLGLVPTALAYLLFARGMRTATATEASIVTLLEPLTAAGLAWLLFGERLGPLGLAGALVLLGAMGLLTIGVRAGRNGAG